MFLIKYLVKIYIYKINNNYILKKLSGKSTLPSFFILFSSEDLKFDYIFTSPVDILLLNISKSSL
jgi:hypothetical protein